VAALVFSAASPEARKAVRQATAAEARLQGYVKRRSSPKPSKPLKPPSAATLRRGAISRAVEAEMDRQGAKPNKDAAYAALIRPDVLKATNLPDGAIGTSVSSIRRIVTRVMNERQAALNKK
jgi:hypothetical protein